MRQQVHTIQCAACAGSRLDSETTHKAEHNSQTYHLYRCRTCELMFWWPLKADPGIYMDEGFDAYVDYHSGSRPFPRWAEPLFRDLPPKRTNALDIGCGDGAVLGRLGSHGYDVHGIDLDEKSIAIARSKYGLSGVSSLTLDQFIEASRTTRMKFALVTAFEVLEHQDAPLDFLAQVITIGEPDGTFAGSVPNRERFLARIDRRLSDGDLPPHHFLWFSKRALESLLQRAGFRNISVERTGALGYGQIIRKLNVIAARKAQALPRGLAWLRHASRLAAPIVAIIPWLGMRASPSHLFFRCRIPIAPNGASDDSRVTAASNS